MHGNRSARPGLPDRCPACQRLRLQPYRNRPGRVLGLSWRGGSGARVVVPVTPFVFDPLLVTFPVKLAVLAAPPLGEPDHSANAVPVVTTATKAPKKNAFSPAMFRPPANNVSGLVGRCMQAPLLLRSPARRNSTIIAPASGASTVPCDFAV